MPGSGAAQGHPFPQSTGTRYRTPAVGAPNARGERLRSTETILNPTRAAKQGSFCLDEHLTFYAREASVAPAAPVQTAISEITTPLA